MTPEYPEKPHALIDCDILTYSIPYMFMEEEDWDTCLTTLNKKIVEIIDKTGAQTWDLYLTGKGNFRNEVAVTLPYKGQRKKDKPTHYALCRSYLENEWGAKVINGMEADDAIAIAAEGSDDCIICTLDKDLRQVKGWHYKWTVGEREDKLWYIDELGYVELNDKRKLEFGGLKGLYAQMILGDKIDNVQGLHRRGDVFAYEALKDLSTPYQMFRCICKLYKDEFEDTWKERFKENWVLLYMLRSPL